MEDAVMLNQWQLESAEKTPWFEGPQWLFGETGAFVFPVHPGVYQVWWRTVGFPHNCEETPSDDTPWFSYSYWDGKKWHSTGVNHVSGYKWAWDHRDQMTSCPITHWRGITLAAYNALQEFL